MIFTGINLINPKYRTDSIGPFTLHLLPIPMHKQEPLKRDQSKTSAPELRKKNYLENFIYLNIISLYYEMKGKYNTGEKWPSQLKGAVIRSTKRRGSRHYINR